MMTTTLDELGLFDADNITPRDFAGDGGGHPVLAYRGNLAPEIIDEAWRKLAPSNLDAHRFRRTPEGILLDYERFRRGGDYGWDIVEKDGEFTAVWSENAELNLVA